ncbi:MAG: DegT/DnrJ/EryC1/StrS family aminotransferase [Deltaproteobacteria bacterium]|nr:DegT/DnrJ/EryC1/StrS family aminotransferase [Deltaproteobacteria bacterium]
MKVPLLDLPAQYATIRTEIRAAIDRVCDSQRFILGPEVAALEEELATFCSVGFALGVSSGTDALLMVLMALGIGPGDEVITTPYSFFATAGVVARLGARPVFVDIDTATFNLDTAAISTRVTARTKAILPVHLFGGCVDLDPVLDIAKERGIAVIEDAAHHGGKGKYTYQLIGGNFRLDTLQAAVLRAKLPYLPGWTAARRRNAERYRRLFSEAGLLDRVILPTDSPGHIYHQFVIRVPERDRLQIFLREREVETEIYYPLPLHMQECFGELGYRDGDFPQAESAARTVLALPIYAELTEPQQRYVVSQIDEFYAD